MVKKEDIKVGAVYEGKSGMQKEVTGIKELGAGKISVEYKVVKAGTGKGNHPQAGTTGIQGGSPFASWAVRQVQ